MENRFSSVGLLHNNLPRLQYELGVEELIRTNLGKIDFRHFSLRGSRKNILQLIRWLNERSYLCSPSTVATNYLYNEYTLLHKEGVILLSLSIDEVTPNLTECELYSTKDFYTYFTNLCKELNLREYKEKPRKPKPDLVDITFAFPSSDGVDYRQKDFPGIPFKSISKNYTPDVVSKVKSLIEEIKEVSHGLVLISGPVGTGKSYLIRSILTELKEERTGAVCNPSTYFLSQAGVLSQVVMEMGKSIIILEDIGDLLVTSSAPQFVDAHSNLLNLTEGFLSLLMDAIIIVSCNHNSESIDPAIRRPGRCLADIQIGKLDIPQVRSLLPPIWDSRMLDKKDYSLAEVYELLKM